MAMISPAERRVEVAGGLVGQEQVRLVDEGARDRHPLLLPAGQLRRAVVHAVGEAHGLEGPPAQARRSTARSE